MGLRELFPSLYGEATELDDRGDSEIAAEYYALRAFAGFIDADYEPKHSSFIGYAHALEAISADVRAGNHRRAIRLFEFVRPMWDELVAVTDDPVRDAILHEWHGDGLLMLDEPEATTYYEYASEVYHEHLSYPTQSNWSFEEEFDYAHWALYDYVEASGYSLPLDRGDLAHDFHTRIDFKLGLTADRFD
ncbi:hypothetical protein [Halomarina rubra]|uniref:Uncharacterized protein n=1 Tax=Halomarina rubra TaxID=2071873 RepID=A0ABD6AVF8_9EURY|nr:hypothetical protein [Halomarina rubra]